MFLGASPKIFHYYNYQEQTLHRSDFKKDGTDWMIFTAREQKELLKPIEEVKEAVDRILSERKYALYVTGGFEGTMAHIQLFEQLNVPIILGLEDDKYIEAKGRAPLRTLDERIDLWSRLLPEGSVIFVVPEMHESDAYDYLATEVGVFRREGVYHVGSSDDREDIRTARRNRALEDHYIEITFGENLHASNYI